MRRAVMDTEADSGARFTMTGYIIEIKLSRMIFGIAPDRRASRGARGGRGADDVQTVWPDIVRGRIGAAPATGGARGSEDRDRAAEGRDQRWSRILQRNSLCCTAGWRSTM